MITFLCSDVSAYGGVRNRDLMFEKISAKEDIINLKKEQCGVVWFLFLLKKTTTECYLMMCEAYRDQVLRCRQVFHWHKLFKEGRTSSMEVKHSGRPVSISTDVTITRLEH